MTRVAPGQWASPDGYAATGSSPNRRTDPMGTARQDLAAADVLRAAITALPKSETPGRTAFALGELFQAHARVPASITRQLLAVAEAVLVEVQED